MMASIAIMVPWLSRTERSENPTPSIEIVLLAMAFALIRFVTSRNTFGIDYCYQAIAEKMELKGKPSWSFLYHQS